MRIEAVDFFYLAMPEVTDEADGSQDALLVRVVAHLSARWTAARARRLPDGGHAAGRTAGARGRSVLDSKRRDKSFVPMRPALPASFL